MRATNKNDDCRVVHAQLLGLWLGDADEATSSALLDHLTKCRSCLKQWIAIQAAADLALASPQKQCDEDEHGEDWFVTRWRPVCMPGLDGSW